VTVLDVGQGLAVVARTSTHALLYDAGPSLGPGADSGNRIILPYLWAAGVKALSGMLVSHDGSDHGGGALSVIQGVPLAWISSSLPDDHRLLARTSGHRRCEAGQNWRWDGVDFEVVHPPVSHYERDRQRHNDRAAYCGLPRAPRAC
jgi:competence protein ComEC